jgi:hypothetical protein
MVEGKRDSIIDRNEGGNRIEWTQNAISSRVKMEIAKMYQDYYFEVFFLSCEPNLEFCGVNNLFFFKSISGHRIILFIHFQSTTLIFIHI